MFKIPFSGNTKDIDLVQVTGLQGFIDFTKKNANRIMFTPGQTIQKMHCIVPEGKKKKANILLVLGICVEK